MKTKKINNMKHKKKKQDRCRISAFIHHCGYNNNTQIWMQVGQGWSGWKIIQLYWKLNNSEQRSTARSEWVKQRSGDSQRFNIYWHSTELITTTINVVSFTVYKFFFFAKTDDDLRSHWRLVRFELSLLSLPFVYETSLARIL
jgi:hypothetical protein